jgi:hypothetical protein
MAHSTNRGVPSGHPARHRNGAARPHGLAGQMARLEELARGLALEAALLQAGNDPLLCVERQACLKGIEDALAGTEAAWAAVAGAVGRLEGP